MKFIWTKARPFHSVGLSQWTGRHCRRRLVTVAIDICQSHYLRPVRSHPVRSIRLFNPCKGQYSCSCRFEKGKANKKGAALSAPHRATGKSGAVRKWVTSSRTEMRNSGNGGNSIPYYVRRDLHPPRSTRGAKSRKKPITPPKTFHSTPETARAFLSEFCNTRSYCRKKSAREYL